MGHHRVTAAVANLRAPDAPACVERWRCEAFNSRLHSDLAKLVQLEGGKLVIGEMEVLGDVKVH